MVWLGNLLVSLVTSIVTYFGAKLSQKTIFATAAVTAFAAITAAFVVAIKALAVGLVYSLPSFMAPTIGMLLPSNLAVCIGAIVGAKLAVAIYQYHLENLKLVSYIT